MRQKGTVRACGKPQIEKKRVLISPSPILFCRKFCLDALSYVGTREAFQVLNENIQKRKLFKPDELKRLFLGLATAPRPTADHINAVWVSERQVISHNVKFMQVSKTLQFSRSALKEQGLLSFSFHADASDTHLKYSSRTFLLRALRKKC